MTFRNHPTDMMGNPDGRDYHYRFNWNDDEAQKRLKHARWKNRYIEMYPKDMKHLRTQIDHVTVKTYDKMGYIKGMKKYAISPDWQRVPYSRGKKEMKHANGGGSKIRSKVRISEKYGEQTVEYHVEATPGEITAAFEDGENESEVQEMMSEAETWAIDDKVEELRQAEYEATQECDHDHVVTGGIGNVAYCEDCPMEWHDEMEFRHDHENGNVTVVSAVC